MPSECADWKMYDFCKSNDSLRSQASEETGAKFPMMMPSVPEFWDATPPLPLPPSSRLLN